MLIRPFFIFTMNVINVKVENIRPRYKNLQEWMQNDKNLYIGRAGVVFINGRRFPQIASVFCNRFKIGRDGSREEVIAKYEKELRLRVENDDEFRQSLLSLKNKTLGCWCKPGACHGDIIVKIVKEIEEESKK